MGEQMVFAGENPPATGREGGPPGHHSRGPAAPLRTLEMSTETGLTERATAGRKEGRGAMLSSYEAIPHPSLMGLCRHLRMTRLKTQVSKASSYKLLDLGEPKKISK